MKETVYIGKEFYDTSKWENLLNESPYSKWETIESLRFCFDIEWLKKEKDYLFCLSQDLRYKYHQDVLELENNPNVKGVNIGYPLFYGDLTTQIDLIRVRIKELEIANKVYKYIQEYKHYLDIKVKHLEQRISIDLAMKSQWYPPPKDKLEDALNLLQQYGISNPKATS